MKKWIAIYALLLACLQAGARQPAAGEVLYIHSVENSNAVYARGKAALEISCRLSLTRQYSLLQTNARSQAFTVQTIAVTDSVALDNAVHYYSSASLSDTTSLAEKAICTMLARTDTVETDLQGIVIRSTCDTTGYFTDSITALMGLVPYNARPGTRFELYATYRLPAYTAGYAWKQADKLAGANVNADCHIITADSATVSIGFTSTTEAPYLNTNTNGTITADARTGMVLSETSLVAALGYTTLGNTVFALGKRSAASRWLLRQTNTPKN